MTAHVRARRTFLRWVPIIAALGAAGACAGRPSDQGEPFAPAREGDLTDADASFTPPLDADAAIPETLRAAARQARAGSPFLGTAAEHVDLLGPDSGDPAYRDVMAREYDLITTNAVHWKETEPREGVFDFRRADQVLAYAKAHGMAVRAHALLYPRDFATPGWVLAIENAPGKTQSQKADLLRAALVNHIRAKATYFKGKVIAWDVVNEALGRDNVFRRLLGDADGKATGYEYVRMAFEAAASALGPDDSTLLFYNDNSMELDNARSDATYAMVRDLKARGIRIDGIGFQFHSGIGTVASGEIPTDGGAPVDTPAPATVTPDAWKANAQRFIDLGLKVAITEMDLSLPRAPHSSAILQEQGRRYFDYVKACIDLPACAHVVTWGFTDKHTWMDSYSTPTNPARTDRDPLLFTETYEKKPAYFGTLRALAGRARP